MNIQEFLTVESDDVECRARFDENLAQGENTLEAGTPANVDVLTNEIRGLGLNVRLEEQRIGAVPTPPPHSIARACAAERRS